MGRGGGRAVGYMDGRQGDRFLKFFNFFFGRKNTFRLPFGPKNVSVSYLIFKDVINFYIDFLSKRRSYLSNNVFAFNFSLHPKVIILYLKAILIGYLP